MAFLALALVGVDPGDAAGKVDLGPFEPRDIGFAETRGEREAGHIGEVLGQLAEEPLGLGVGEPADAPLGLWEHAHVRGLLEPLPVAGGAAQDGPQDFEHAVDGGWAHAVGAAGAA